MGLVTIDQKIVYPDNDLTLFKLNKGIQAFEKVAKITVYMNYVVEDSLTIPPSATLEVNPNITNASIDIEFYKAIFNVDFNVLTEIFLIQNLNRPTELFKIRNISRVYGGTPDSFRWIIQMSDPITFLSDRIVSSETASQPNLELTGETGTTIVSRIIENAIITPPILDTGGSASTDPDRVLGFFDASFLDISDVFFDTLTFDYSERFKNSGLSMIEQLRKIFEEGNDATEINKINNYPMGIKTRLLPNGKLQYFLFQGFDRTNDGIEKTSGFPSRRKSKVVLGIKQGNLSTLSNTQNLMNFKNVSFTAGSGEGIVREFKEVTINEYIDLPSPVGENRRELFTDARDIDATDDEILNNRGVEKLIETINLQYPSLQIQQAGNLIPDFDFQLGDLISFKEEFKNNPVNDLGFKFNNIDYLKIYDTYISSIRRTYNQDTIEFDIKVGTTFPNNNQKLIDAINGAGSAGRG